MENHLNNFLENEHRNVELITWRDQDKKKAKKCIQNIGKWVFSGQVGIPFTQLELQMANALQRNRKLRRTIEEFKNLLIYENLNEVADDEKTEYVRILLYKLNFNFILKQSYELLFVFIKKIKYKIYPLLTNIDEMADYYQALYGRHAFFENFKNTVNGFLRYLKRFNFDRFSQSK